MDYAEQWRADLAAAYSNGLEDGKARKTERPDQRATGGFVAAYRQGYGHGLNHPKP